MNPDPATNPAPETPLGELLIALESAECSCYSNPSGPCEYCRIIQKMQRVADKLQEPVPTVESAKVDAGWIIASHVTGEFVPVEIASALERALAGAKRENAEQTEVERTLAQLLGKCAEMLGLDPYRFDPPDIIDEIERLKADKEDTRAFLEAAIKEQVEQAEHWKEHYKTDPQGRVDSAFWIGKEDAFKACLHLVQSTTTQEGQG